MGRQECWVLSPLSVSGEAGVLDTFSSVRQRGGRSVGYFLLCPSAGRQECWVLSPLPVSGEAGVLGTFSSVRQRGGRSVGYFLLCPSVGRQECWVLSPLSRPPAVLRILSQGMTRASLLLTHKPQSCGHSPTQAG